MKKVNKLPNKIRVRFSPSPTGLLHIGGARTALFNSLFAKQNKGALILRIEDTDKERSKLEWVQNIIDELKWLGIEWDEGPDIGGKFGPYKQSQRLDIYKKYLEKLLAGKKAYYCTCATEELEAKRQEQASRGLAPKYDGKCRDKAHTSGVIRFKVENKKVKFKDLVRGEVEFDTGLLGDIVVAKDLENPLYHFAVVADDFEMQISHVIRGEEHLSNTPRQILLQEALGFYQPIYTHLPLMLNPDKSKMSKRAAAHAEPGRASPLQGGRIVAVFDYHKAGYLPEALINFVVLLGWNPGTEREIFSLKDLVKEFSLEKVQKGGAVFNLQRLDFINNHYIKEKPTKQLVKLCMPYLVEADLIDEKYPSKTLEKIIEVYKARFKKLSDVVLLCDFFFKDPSYDKSMLTWKKMTEADVKESLAASEKVLQSIKKWDIKSLEESLLKEAVEFNKNKGYPEKDRGYLLWPLRVALSSKEASASPFEIAEILGKEKTLQRIQTAKN